MMLLTTIITLLTLNTVRSQKPSPCPHVLIYEPKNSENDRWYAVVNLSSRESLRGLWLTITLDRPAELLGNIFGDAATTNNREFLIRSNNYVLEAGTVTPVRFFVKYNSGGNVPSVSEINLNGRSICSATDEQTTVRNSARPTTSNRKSSNTNGRPSSSATTRPTHVDTSSRPNSNARPLGFTSERPSRPVNTNQEVQRPNRPSNSNARPTTEYLELVTPNRPSHANARPSSFTEDLEVVRPNRPINGRPSSSTDDLEVARPSRPSSSTDRHELDGYNRPDRINPDAEVISFRPEGPDNGYNQGSTGYGNGYNVNGDNQPSYGNNREPDGFSANTNYNQGSSSLSASSQDNDDFFAGDFSAIVSRPPSNPSTRPSAPRNQRCGLVATQARPLISYGQDTEPGQWPWHTALYHSKGIQLMYTCGGTLISTSHILTAAHCVTKPRTNRPINPQNILAYLGKYNLRKFGSEIQDREVGDIYIHPQYNYSGYYNDIAILRLVEPVEITNYVRPVCLWDEHTDLNEVEGKLGTVVGWGFNENGVLTTTLMQAQMPIVSLAKCIYSNRDFFSQFTSEKSFCAGFRNGTSVCNGDSGGGMVFPRRGTSGSNTVWQIRGLVSVGVAFQGKIICDTSQYVVFTDVAKHLDWIQTVLNNYP
ncbi:serine proteinase stubble-like [Coccinella septempunctata]|uniref:serine proteinase stubble-like n=1 Tax=Coccinella septempunctata TaxID=41139 RepID=UPI001D072D5C|nr:serine proteinase stubble-like [Coccinella septempunctata]XP_044763415.1 serine proteinase stubble-like [Coccinella septempunctata]